MICGSVIHILFCLDLPFRISLHEQVMCTEHLQERRELIMALHKDRKLSNLPKITQVGVYILFLWWSTILHKYIHVQWFSFLSFLHLMNLNTEKRIGAIDLWLLMVSVRLCWVEFQYSLSQSAYFLQLFLECKFDPCFFISLSIF